MTSGIEQFGLTGRRALVTGSSQGIGLALAQGLAEAGASLVLNGRNVEKLDMASAALSAAGHEVTVSAFDVTDHDAVRDAVGGLEENVGPIDILINNAGIQHRAPLEEFPPEAFERLLQTNVASVFHVGQAVARHMIARGRGKIVNVASINSAVARSSIGPYVATKGAVMNLTKAMATEWARHGLNCNALAPGYIETPLTATLLSDETFATWLKGRTPAGRWAQVHELIGATVFLASDAAAFVNGHTLYVDGGITATL